MPAWPMVPAEYNIDIDADADRHFRNGDPYCLSRRVEDSNQNIFRYSDNTWLDETRIDIHNAYCWETISRVIPNQLMLYIF